MHVLYNGKAWEVFWRLQIAPTSADSGENTIFLGQAAFNFFYKMAALFLFFIFARNI